MHAPIFDLNAPVSVHAHHTESVDPTLAGWINDLLHDILGWGPWTFVVVLGIAIVAVPLWLICNAFRHTSAESESEANDD
jgi:hypothetical protein